MTQTPTDALRLVTTPLDKLEAVYDWLREPDHGDTFNKNDLVEWLNRRPSGLLMKAIGELRQSTRAAAPASPLPLTTTPEPIPPSTGVADNGASPLPEGGGANHLGNLLARIHRDGGHRQEEIGTDQACDEAELIVSDLLQDQQQWQKIETFTESGQGNPVIVAVPAKEGGWIVGEAWKSVMEPDDAYRGNDGWWWAGTSTGDACNDPIRFMNHGDAEWWMPLPAAPTGAK
ncbi:hypothetical protein [Brevundimonas sp. Marseille-Q4549]